MAAKVELWCAPIPGLSWIAVHYWFVVYQGDTLQRWEVWQTANAGGSSWDHVHRDLKMPFDAVGGGPGWCEACWSGDDAARIAQVLSQCPQTYPFVSLYRKWPGPNSNSFAQWILDQARMAYDLGPRGIGKDWLGRWCGYSAKAGRLHIESPLLGLRYRSRERIELHVLTLTLGANLNPFCIGRGSKKID